MLTQTFIAPIFYGVTGRVSFWLLVHCLQHVENWTPHTLASEGLHQPTSGWAEGDWHTSLDDPNHARVDWTKWHGILIRFFEGRCRKCGPASIQPVCETIWVHCLPCLLRIMQDWTSFRGLLSGSGTFVITSYILPFAVKLNYPRLKRWIVEHTPSRWVRDLKEITDTIQETAVDIYRSKQKAMIEGDDGKKDIISILCMILAIYTYTTETKHERISEGQCQRRGNGSSIRRRSLRPSCVCPLLPRFWHLLIYPPQVFDICSYGFKFFSAFTCNMSSRRKSKDSKSTTSRITRGEEYQ